MSRAAVTEVARSAQEGRVDGGLEVAAV